jgi:cytidylate kinase
VNEIENSRKESRRKRIRRFPVAVITISREPCSGGSQVAEAVAAELGYGFVQKKTIEQVLVQYGFVGLKDAYDSIPNFWTRFDEETKRVVDMFDRVIMAMAKLGDVVIMGRGAFKVLEGFNDVLHVKIKSPYSLRVSTFMKRYGSYDRALAESAIREADKLRSAYLEVHYGTKMDSVIGFDLVLDTGKIFQDSAIPLVVAASKAVNFTNIADPASTASIDVDKVLLAAAKRVLGRT